ncbi:MAG TPA: nuclear transport factor 2 family protein [Candidatus Krumholzibacteria bacterium]|nr:nuclear transport factor 2 family protein [Candidatus Krumholzibacteria bacterium]
MRWQRAEFVVVGLLALFTTVAAKSPPVGDEAVAAVERMENERRAAMVAVDVHALARIFDADATYVHSTGLMQSRDDVFGMLTRGDIRYVGFEVESVAYRAYGSTVLGTGVQKIDLASSGKSLTSRSRFTVVYAVSRGELHLVSYQSTSMPEVVKQETVGDGKPAP